MARDDWDIDSSFETIGAFWPYEDPATRFTGSLSCDEGRIVLKSAPVYSAGDVNEAAESFFLSLNERKKSERIHSLVGYTAEGECTLLSVLPLDDGGMIDFSTGQRISSQQYRAWAGVIGLHVESLHNKQIHSATYHFTKIHQWLSTALNIRWEQTSQSFLVPTKESEVFRLHCAELGTEILCEVRAHGRVRGGRTATIRSSVRIIVTPDHQESVKWFYEIGTRLENFLSLCLGTSVALTRLVLADHEKEGCFVRRQRLAEEKIDRHLWVKCSSDMLATSIRRWLSVPKEKRAVERTLLDILRKSSVPWITEFLSLAQAFEGFDRIHRHPGRREFAKRMEDVCGMLSRDFAQQLIGEQTSFVRTVVDTRNFYTHLGISAGTSALEEGEALFELNQRLSALLRCVILLDLGMDESNVRGPILHQATKWRLA